MKEQIIKIIKSKAQGKYHLEIDEPDLEVIANEILSLFNVSNCCGNCDEAIINDPYCESCYDLANSRDNT
jgi:hypothetical protein